MRNIDCPSIPQKEMKGVTKHLNIPQGEIITPLREIHPNDIVITRPIDSHPDTSKIGIVTSVRAQIM